jgi:long-chain acyl-CoA synthetase
MDRPWLNHYDPGVPHEIEIPDVPFTVILDQTVARYPQQTAVYFYGHRWTYRQLDRITNRFANALIGLGSGPATGWHCSFPTVPNSLPLTSGHGRPERWSPRSTLSTPPAKSPTT